MYGLMPYLQVISQFYIISFYCMHDKLPPAPSWSPSTFWSFRRSPHGFPGRGMPSVPWSLLSERRQCCSVRFLSANATNVNFQGVAVWAVGEDYLHGPQLYQVRHAPILGHRISVCRHITCLKTYLNLAASHPFRAWQPLCRNFLGSSALAFRHPAAVLVDEVLEGGNYVPVQDVALPVACLAAGAELLWQPVKLHLESFFYT